MTAPLNQRDLSAVFERAARDPVWMISRVFGDDLWPKQKEIVRSVRDHRETAVKSCHAAGKSFTAARIALAFGISRRPSIVVTTAPTARQVKTILWKEIRVAHARAKAPLGGEVMTQELRWAPDWFMIGFTANEYSESAFQGIHERDLLAIVDEAAGVSPQIQDGIDALLTSDRARKLQIGNPTDPSTPFAQAFKRSSVSRISISAFDTPNFTRFGITLDDMTSGRWRDKVTGDMPAPHLVTPEWVANALEKWGPTDPRFVARVLAEFPEESKDCLIPMAWILRAQERGNGDPEPHWATEPNEDGIDVATSGDDRSVVARRNGVYARISTWVRGHDTMEVCGMAVRHAKEHSTRLTKVDAIGVGAGVHDRLRELGVKVAGINVGAGAHDKEQFLNLRAELFWGLRERFRTNDIVLVPDEHGRHDDDLAKELNAIRYRLTSRGQIQIEDKAETKKRLEGHSPDKADALMLAFAPAQRVEVVMI